MLYPKRFLVSLQFGYYRVISLKIYFADLLSKIVEIIWNLLQKSSWFKKSFDCLTYFIE